MWHQDPELKKFCLLDFSQRVFGRANLKILADLLNSTETFIRMLTDTLIEIKELSFSYGNRAILKGINLTVPRGKVVAIMGGSGCGKTTLLRLIGVQSPHLLATLCLPVRRCISSIEMIFFNAPKNKHVVSIWRIVHRSFGV